MNEITIEQMIEELNRIAEGQRGRIVGKHEVDIPAMAHDVAATLERLNNEIKRLQFQQTEMEAELSTVKAMTRGN